MTPIRFRSCLGTTTRTPTPLRWSVPSSTLLRTANHSSLLKSAWEGSTGSEAFNYEQSWFSMTTIKRWTAPFSLCIAGEKGAFLFGKNWIELVIMTGTGSCPSRWCDGRGLVFVGVAVDISLTNLYIQKTSFGIKFFLGGCLFASSWHALNLLLSNPYLTIYLCKVFLKKLFPSK